MRPALAGIGVAAVALLVALAIWARLEPVGQWELALLVALAPEAGLHSDTVRALNAFGDLDVWAVFVVALAGIALALRRPLAALAIALTLLSDVAGYLVKVAVERERPEGALLDSLIGTDSFAFPSGHVVRATALTGLLAWLLVPARLRLPVALVAGLAAGAVMGYGRIALGVHWPTDVAGGILLGLAWFAGSALLLHSGGRREPAAA